MTKFKLSRPTGISASKLIGISPINVTTKVVIFVTKGFPKIHSKIKPLKSQRENGNIMCRYASAFF